MIFLPNGDPTQMSAPDFPLYKSLAVGLPNKDLTVLQKNDLLSTIEKMTLEGREMVYALIKCFSIEKDQEDTIPYQGQRKGENLHFDLAKFPQELRQLLYKFSKIYKKKQEEDLALKSLHEPDSS